MTLDLESRLSVLHDEITCQPQQVVSVMQSSTVLLFNSHDQILSIAEGEEGRTLEIHSPRQRARWRYPRSALDVKKCRHWFPGLEVAGHVEVQLWPSLPLTRRNQHEACRF